MPDALGVARQRLDKIETIVTYPGAPDYAPTRLHGALEQLREIRQTVRQRGAVAAAVTRAGWESVTSRAAPFDDPLPRDPFGAAAARVQRQAAWLAILLEVGLIIWIAPVVIAAASLAAVLIYAAISLGVGGVAHGGSDEIGAHAENQQQGRVRLRDRLGWLQVLAGVLAVIFVVERAAPVTWNSRYNWVFPALGGLLGFVFSALAGTRFALAASYEALDSHVATVLECADILRVTERLEVAVRRLLTGLGQLPPAGTALILLALFFRSADAQEPRALIAMDASASVMPEWSEKAATLIAASAPSLSFHWGLRRWDVLSFTDDGYFAIPHKTVRWPQSEVALCSSAVTELGKILRSVQDAEHAASDSVCRLHRKQAADERAAAVTEALRLLRDAMLAAPKRRGTCTSVTDIIVRVGAMPLTLGLVVTDGSDTCGLAVQAAQKVLAKRVLILIVPSVPTPGEMKSRESLGQIMAGRVEALRKAFPWAEVMPLWGLESLEDLDSPSPRR